MRHPISGDARCITADAQRRGAWSVRDARTLVSRTTSASSCATWRRSFSAFVMVASASLSALGSRRRGLSARLAQVHLRNVAAAAVAVAQVHGEHRARLARLDAERAVLPEQVASVCVTQRVRCMFAAQSGVGQAAAIGPRSPLKARRRDQTPALGP